MKTANIPTGGRIIGLVISDGRGNGPQMYAMQNIPPYLQAAITRFNAQMTFTKQECAPESYAQGQGRIKRSAEEVRDEVP